jgi:hypothetical protein
MTIRLWLLQPKLLCNLHLWCEHIEAHVFAMLLEGKNSLQYFIDRGVVEVHNIRPRHDALAVELLRRGMKHDRKWPLPKFTEFEAGHVDRALALRTLTAACTDCARRANKLAAQGIPLYEGQ